MLSTHQCSVLSGPRCSQHLLQRETAGPVCGGLEPDHGAGQCLVTRRTNTYNHHRRQAHLTLLLMKLSQTEIYCCCRRVESVSCSEESSQHGAGVQPRQSQHGAHQLGPQEDKCVNESSRNKIFREGTQKHIHTWNY